LRDLDSLKLHVESFWQPIEPKKIREIEKKFGRRVVDLTGATSEEFYKECDEFVDYVRSMAS